MRSSLCSSTGRSPVAATTCSEPHTVPFLTAAGWLICGLLSVVLLAHLVQRQMSLDEGPFLAVAYDLLPLALFAAPVIGVVALVSGHDPLRSPPGC